MLPEWIPTPGDRIRTVITTDSKHELVYLNSETAILATVNDKFLILTSEWQPWAHQIIDWLSIQRNIDRQTVLKFLLEFEKQNTELDFDSLCAKFLKHYLEQKSFSFMEA